MNPADLIQQIKNLQNPYPEDIFTPMNCGDYELYNKTLKSAGLCMTHLNGNVARRTYEACRQDIIELIERLEEKA